MRIALLCPLLMMFSVHSSLAQTPPPSSAPPPFPNRANEVMPSWLRLRAEFRERIEGSSGIQFATDREDGYFLSRLRLNATIRPGRFISGAVQAQDGRVAAKTVGSTAAPFTGTFDLRLAHMDLGNAATSAVFARFGRQELVYGEQRLVGHSNWTNTARSFDGARASFKKKGYQADVFAASVVRIQADEFDKSGNGNRFLGAYGVVSAWVPKSTIEPFVFWRADQELRTETGSIGDLGATTTGVRWVGTLPKGLDYGLDMAIQRGSLGTDAVSAWAGHWQLRHTASGSFALRTTAEYNHASGDANPADGTRGTFDQLYPTAHDKYGLADQVGWKNVSHMRAGVEFTPRRGWPVTTNYHSWWLADVHDALYNAASAAIARVPGGAAESHVGQEIDVQLTRALWPQLQVSGGYAHIFPGGFLKEATPGQSYSYGYFMATYVFLAER
jgi:hypothetical protein